jgi:hypothetical protein
MEERREFKLGDPRRFCKHMVKAMMQNSSKQKMPKVVHKLFSDADRAGKGLYFDEYKIVTIDGLDVIISKSSDGSWYSVIVQEEEDGDGVRYSYNPIEWRWAYNREPKDADKFIKLIDGWS